MTSSALYLLVLAPLGILVYWLLPAGRTRHGWLAAWSALILTQYAGAYAIPTLGCAVWTFAWSGVAARSNGAKKSALTAVAIAAPVAYMIAVKWPGDPVAAATGPAWIAPLAVSYLGFQLIHFAVERARGNIAPDARSSTFWSYALFFPTLPAGPIKRYENFRAQAESAAPFDTDLFTKGVFRVAVGFAKKSVLAYPAYVWLDGWQGATESAVAAWLGVYCYFAYIYLDFSAYSDIAIGAAAMMGLRVEENFRWPIFASNPSEFWKRWHMTMTGFLRDYVFIPLGGSREGALQTAVNTIITMTLIGLWHGIAWNFLAWGLYHAALLLGYRVWRNILPTHRLGRPGRALGVLATFHLVGAGWILFDNPFRDALPLLRALAPF